MKLPSIAALALSVLALAPQPAEAAEKLTLRVNDARGGPGDLVSVVVRTYASRPIAQGQICIGARRQGRNRSVANPAGNAAGEAATGSPFASLERVEVFSARQDATFQVSFDGEGADVTFRSPSGSINAVDGPLAVFHFRLSGSVRDEEVYDLALDLEETFVVAGSGQRIAIEPKPGELEIREDDDGGGEEDSVELAVTGGAVRRGKTARVKLATRDAVALSSGRIALRFDPRILAGKPWVRIDPRHGRATVLVSTDTPGLVIIDFQSPDRSFNRSAGEIFEVRAVISRQAPRGRSPVIADKGLSFLRDRGGDALDLEIRNGALVIR